MRHALIFCNYTDATRVFSCVFNLIRISWRIGVGDATVECSFAKIRYHCFTEKDLLKMLLYHPLSVYHFFVKTFPCPGALEAPSSKSDTQSSEVNPLPDRFVPRCFHRTKMLCEVKKV